ncbi:hypothetical protein LF1_46440 [Rubripirellula obstinata]|uniref:Uncharacterized protein n=1 Tax=Rubripirellula obstinata TaxID=406547 RepID=A0A5B1CRS1_9BACT|nr:hypothetical protein LF1_46440 [Rubripirellula obstinata]
MGLPVAQHGFAARPGVPHWKVFTAMIIRLLRLRPLAIQPRGRLIWLATLSRIVRINRIATFSRFGYERRRQNLPLRDAGGSCWPVLR